MRPRRSSKRPVVSQPRDRSIDFSRPGKVAPLDKATAKLYTSATQLLPTDGIVKKTSAEITRGAGSDVRNGQGDLRMDCGQHRAQPQEHAAAVPATFAPCSKLATSPASAPTSMPCMSGSHAPPACRHATFYGIRVADSRFGYKSLGKSGDITRAQHCRAEVWLAGFGWVPVDPADVRKIVLEEKPGLVLADDVVVAARNKLFGAWEMNWAGVQCRPRPRATRIERPENRFPDVSTGRECGRCFDSLRSGQLRYKHLREIGLSGSARRQGNPIVKYARIFSGPWFPRGKTKGERPWGGSPRSSHAPKRDNPDLGARRAKPSRDRPRAARAREPGAGTSRTMKAPSPKVTAEEGTGQDVITSAENGRTLAVIEVGEGGGDVASGTATKAISARRADGKSIGEKTRSGRRKFAEDSFGAARSRWMVFGRARRRWGPD
jgi:hypothetical protein